MRKFYTLFLLLIGFCSFSQVYNVQPITHQMYQGTATVQFSGDDTYSGVIPIPFPFNFYGTTYSNLLVSSNGYVTFDTSTPNALSPWSFNVAIPNPTFPTKNAIFGIYTDLNNVNSTGNYFTGISGTAPNRKFVINFINVPFFQCTTSHLTSQIILYESTNIIDVQVLEKQACATWNSGNALLGVLDASGANGIAAPGRNTSSWSATNEGWRFTPYSETQPVLVTFCSITNATVSLTPMMTGIFSNATFYTSTTDALTNSNPINPSTFVPVTNPQTLYALLNNGTIDMLPVTISTVDCGTDADTDAIPTAEEDINNDGNLANDDTDGDGMPNYLDDDDDGDLVLTNIELINLGGRTSTYQDTDNDGIANYLDIDDDGDGIISINEDYNNNGNLQDDDLNTNGVPDYLDASVLGINEPIAATFNITVFPNPVQDKVTVKGNTNLQMQDIQVLSLTGQVIETKFNASGDNTFEINTSKLSSGIYLLVIKSNDLLYTRKISKK
ncbi:MAG: T9SS type A sorting domain-containing protein [Flavobacterium sp.]|nr:T9SS type A sorting domain-containing protein [Flavobacterium sp.]